MAKNPENTAEKQSGRFKPGVSGNPAGKPVGARHKVTRAIEALLDSEHANAHPQQMRMPQQQRQQAHVIDFNDLPE